MGCGQPAIYRLSATAASPYRPPKFSCGRPLCNAAVVFVGRQQQQLQPLQQFFSPPDRVIGIPNLGNICWISPVFQALARLRPPTIDFAAQADRLEVARRTFGMVAAIRDGTIPQTRDRRNKFLPDLTWLTEAFGSQPRAVNDLTEFVAFLLETFASGKNTPKGPQDKLPPESRAWVSLFRWRQQDVIWGPSLSGDDRIGAKVAGPVMPAPEREHDIPDAEKIRVTLHDPEYGVYRLYLDPLAPVGYKLEDYLRDCEADTLTVDFKMENPQTVWTFEDTDPLVDKVKRQFNVPETILGRMQARRIQVTSEIEAALQVAVGSDAVSDSMVASLQYARDTLKKREGVEQTDGFDMTFKREQTIAKMSSAARNALVTSVRRQYMGMIPNQKTALLNDTANNVVRFAKWTTIAEAPSVLIIELSRSRWTGKRAQATQTLVPFDATLTLPVEIWTPTGRHHPPPPTYRLFAVIRRKASGGGHFLIYTVDAAGAWYAIDDSVVTAVSFETVKTVPATMLWYTML